MQSGFEFCLSVQQHSVRLSHSSPPTPQLSVPLLIDSGFRFLSPLLASAVGICMVYNFVISRCCCSFCLDRVNVICARFPTFQPALQTSANIYCEKCLCARSYVSEHFLTLSPSESQQAITKADFSAQTQTLFCWRFEFSRVFLSAGYENESCLCV